MATKKKGKRPVRRTAVKKTKTAVKKATPKKTKSVSKTKPNVLKETVRVKTFIVEKPVYVEVPTRMKEPPAKARHPDYFTKFDAKESRYAKDDEEDIYAPLKESSKDRPEMGESEEDFRDFPEGDESEAPIGEDGELDESEEGMDGGSKPKEGAHSRSRAMFSGKWWQRAFWQAAAIWIAIFIFAFFMDLINLSEVELQRNWIYLFIGIFIAMLVYQKVLKGKLIK